MAGKAPKEQSIKLLKASDFNSGNYIKHLTLFILPYILLYGLYIQINGDISPGGGFQAGVVFASILIGLELGWDQLKLTHYFSPQLLIFTATIGALIYVTVGILSLLFNHNYLNYYSFASDKLLAQHIGIFTIEVGIGLCVSSVMYLIYSQFR